MQHISLENRAHKLLPEQGARQAGHIQALPQKWLVLRLSALGDVVLSTGLLEYWSQRYGWVFDVLTKEQFKPVFLHNPAVGKVHSFPSHSSLVQEYAFLSALAREYAGWGLLDLHGTWRSRLLASLWHGEVQRYPKQSLRRRLFLASSKRIGKSQLRQYNVPQRYSLAIEKQAPERALLRPCIYLTDQEKETARARIASLPVLQEKQAGQEKKRPLVALHPYATHPNKAWSEENWRALSSKLTNSGIPWMSIGVGQPLFPDNPADMTNQTTLREACALLANVAVLISGDSGPMHLACAVQTPVIALFGPTTQEWGFYPEGSEHTILETESACRPCSLHGKQQCTKAVACMQSISPEQVFSTLVKKLAKSKAYSK